MPYFGERIKDTVSLNGATEVFLEFDISGLPKDGEIQLLLIGGAASVAIKYYPRCFDPDGAKSTSSATQSTTGLTIEAGHNFDTSPRYLISLSWFLANNVDPEYPVPYEVFKIGLKGAGGDTDAFRGYAYVNNH